MQKNLAVGQHLLDAGYIGRIDGRQLLQLAHAARGFEAGKVALGCMAAQDFPGRRDLEALASSTMRLQLHFRFRSVSWHYEDPLLFLKPAETSASSNDSCSASAGARHAAPLQIDSAR